MKEIALYTLDIAQNSITAQAKRLDITLTEEGETITLSIRDDGTGMAPELLARVSDPFTTTRTTRAMGLGLPLLRLAAEQTGGSVFITSEPGKGTEVTATFLADHIDCPPWGDLPGTVAMLITGNPEINVCFEYHAGETAFSISTNEIKEILDGIPLNHPKVMLLVKEMIKENL